MASGTAQQPLPSGTLGTIPQAALGAAIPGVLDATLERFTGPLPTVALQRAAREALLDPSVAQASGPFARARALYALGFLEDAAGVAVQARPETVADRALSARLFLALGRTAQACESADVDKVPEGAEPGPTFELLEALAFCKLEQGDADAARLIVDLTRKQGGSDRLFRVLMGARGGGVDLPRASSVTSVRPVHMALLRRAGQPLSAAYAARMDLALTRAIAIDEAFAMDVRIAAAERAAEAGLVEADMLVSLYGLTPLDETLLMQAATGNAPAGPAARAHLFALIAEASDDRSRLGFVTEMMRQARQAGVESAVAAAISEDVAAVYPESGLMEFAGLAVEALIQGGRPDIAVGWVDAGALPGVDGRPALSAIEAHRLSAMIAMSAPEVGVTAGAGALGADAGGAKISAADRAFIARQVALMTVLGDRVSSILLELAGGSGTGGAPPPQGGGPAGLVTALAPAAGTDLAALDNAALAGAVGALGSYGFEGEARQTGATALAALVPR